MPRFRPPKLPKALKALEGPLTALYEDLQGLIASPGDVAIRSTTYRPSPGETVRVSPPPEGMGLVLPPPSAENRASEITVLIERPAGDLRVFVSQDGPAGPSGAPTIDGQEMQTYSSEGALRFKSNGVSRWCDARGAAGAAGATGPTGPAGADSAMRQLQRFAWYTNGDREEYDEDNVLVTTTTSSTLALADLHASARMVDVWAVPSGSSGGSGSRNTINSNTGGSGAGGPDIGHEMFSIEAIEPHLPITVTVGSAAAAATGITAGRTAVAGNDGNTGNPSSFGSLLAGYPGGPGRGGLNTGGSIGGGTGGGSHGAGVIGGSGVAAVGGAPATDTDKHGIGHAGAGSHATADATGIGSSGRAAEGGGASGGGATVGSSATGRGGHGGNSNRGGPGAGAGGNASTANRPGGGNGGGYGYRTDGSLAGNGVAGPTIGAGQGNGTDGTDGTDGSVLTLTPGLPGSGGMSCRIDSGATSFTSGRGGHGGFPGGSSGGSGSGFVNGGTGNLTIAASGDPADGVVVAVIYG